MHKKSKWFTPVVGAFVSLAAAYPAIVSQVEAQQSTPAASYASATKTDLLLLSPEGLRQLQAQTVVSCAKQQRACTQLLGSIFGALEDTRFRLESTEQDLDAAIMLSEQLGNRTRRINTRYDNLAAQYNGLQAQYATALAEFERNKPDADVATLSNSVQRLSLELDALSTFSQAMLDQRDEAWDDNTSLSDAVTQLSQRLRTAEADKTALRDQIEKLSEDFQSAELDKQDLVRQLSEAQMQNAQLADDLLRLETNLEVAVTDRDGLAAQLVKAEAALDATSESALTTEATLKSELAALSEKFDKANSLADTLANSVRTVEVEKVTLRDRIDQLLQDLASAQLTSQDTKLQLQSAEAATADLADQMLNLDEQLQIAVQDRDGLAKQLVEATNERQDLQDNSDDLRLQLNELERAKTELAQALETAVARNETLTVRAANLENQVTATGRQSQKMRENAEKSQGDKLAILKELSDTRSALEITLAELDKSNQLAEAASKAFGNLKNLTPTDLRDVEDFGENPQNYVYNNVVTGWMRNKDFGNLTPTPGDRVAFATAGIRQLQIDMNTWLRDRKLTTAVLAVPFQSRICGAFLCEDGVVGKRTKQVAEYIYTKDPSFFPGSKQLDELDDLEVAKKPLETIPSERNN